MYQAGNHQASGPARLDCVRSGRLSLPPVATGWIIKTIWSYKFNIEKQTQSCILKWNIILNIALQYYFELDFFFFFSESLTAAVWLLVFLCECLGTTISSCCIFFKLKSYQNAQFYDCFFFKKTTSTNSKTMYYFLHCTQMIFVKAVYFFFLQTQWIWTYEHTTQRVNSSAKFKSLHEQWCSWL